MNTASPDIAAAIRLAEALASPWDTSCDSERRRRVRGLEYSAAAMRAALDSLRLGVTLVTLLDEEFGAVESNALVRHLVASAIPTVQAFDPDAVADCVMTHGVVEEAGAARRLAMAWLLGTTVGVVHDIVDWLRGAPQPLGLRHRDAFVRIDAQMWLAGSLSTVRRVLGRVIEQLLGASD